ncbi:hypothetical protein BJ944DRAFT_266735 [Cunninghamella echinulata]|nr:hypothetical protein BJ944DRAFT_266735 [Cunninghamella echinulata]
MHLSSGKPITQDEELASIDLHTEHIKKTLHWSIKDLERFIALLKARVVAEETYIQSLSKISKTSSIPEPEPCPYFGSDTTSLRAATMQYEVSLGKIIQSRQELADEIKKQIDVLTEVKEKQENRRKNVKQLVSDRNSQYITFRTRDFVKAKKAYTAKCNELAANQQSIEAIEQVDQHAIIDEPRKSTDNDHDTDGSSINSLQESTHSSNRKKVSGLMAHMKTQFAAATAPDPSKQSARCAKIKKDIHDTDLEYRKSVQILEKFRKSQMEGMINAVKNVEVVFLDKTEAIKFILASILSVEQNVLLKEASLAKTNLGAVYAIDSEKDIILYQKEYQKQNYIIPRRVQYCNFYNGTYKDILFGSSLVEYAKEHQRTVPLVISKCINAIEELGGLQKEGIYRISPRQTNLDMLKAEFEKDEENFEFHSQYDVFTIAAVVKIYLRELASPLLKYNVEERMKYSTIKNPQERLVILQKIVNELPPPRRDTLETVVRHLSKVAENANVNKMNVQNLSYMFTPAIFHDHNQAEHPGEWGSDFVFEDLLHYHTILFSGNQQLQGKDYIGTPISQGASSDFKDSLAALDKEKGNQPEGITKTGILEPKDKENNNIDNNVDNEKHIQFATPPTATTPTALNNNDKNKEKEDTNKLPSSPPTAYHPEKDNASVPPSTTPLPSSTIATPIVISSPTTPVTTSPSPQSVNNNNDIPSPKYTPSKESLTNKELPKITSSNVKVVSPQPIKKDQPTSPASASTLIGEESKLFNLGEQSIHSSSLPSSPNQKKEDKKPSSSSPSGGGGLLRRVASLKPKSSRSSKQKQQSASSPSSTTTPMPSSTEASPVPSPRPEEKNDIKRVILEDKPMSDNNSTKS